MAKLFVVSVDEVTTIQRNVLRIWPVNELELFSINKKLAEAREC